ncbi:flagellar assembly protein FliH [Ferrimonas lipolytica]|uniref:Flagellar assembly protein FliH n=1 Tax=Ferrimonas lipolytica TaxID=2724191 RepID=A0A6H1UE84_9GAMM|nr:flagellar assembly protein FliH [Ferrimonas lipolytica]QIZ77354.1 flagellar assembly protein FliH [Ferrimonas lipolytica]
MSRLGYINPAQVEDWQLEDFDTPVTNDQHAIHGSSASQKAAAEVACELPEPPTLEELEAIQQQAWQEGFDQGKQEGLDKGLAEGRLSGADQGLQEGLEQGRSQGIEAGEQEIQQRCLQWDNLLNELIEPLNAVDNQVEQELVTLAMKLAQAVVQVELKTSEAAVLHALQAGIAALPQQRQQVQICASSEDHQLIEQSYGADELAKRNWQLQLEPSLSKGSLQINTERSQVSLLSEERLHKVLEQFASQPRADVNEPQHPPVEIADGVNDMTQSAADLPSPSSPTSEDDTDANGNGAETAPE